MQDAGCRMQGIGCRAQDDSYQGVTGNLIFMKQFFNVSLLLLILCSCTTIKTGFRNPDLFGFTDLSLREALIIEKNNKAKDVSPDHFIGLGESLYPNINHYRLEIPKSFLRVEKPYFKCQVDYYFTKNDSSVKVILYEWNYLSNADFFEEKENQKKKEKMYSKFREKFEILSSNIEKEIGKPNRINLESKSQPSDFRDDLHWLNAKNRNVYLFMFGNNNQTYRQIRMIIYTE